MTKLSAAAALLLAMAAAVAPSVSAAVVSNTKEGAMRNLVQSARRLEEGDGDGDEYAFMADYTVKFLHCAAGQKTQGEEGYEYSSVVFRLCPASGSCDSDSKNGCSSGYGDMVVGINTFVDSYFEMMDIDDEEYSLNLNEYAQCANFDMDGDDENEDRKRKLEAVEYGPFYIGPECTSDGSNIQMGWFSDYTCSTYETTYTFEEFANGYSLPFSDGGLISSTCNKCAGYNDDGEYEVDEFCTKLYENAGMKCETNMESYSQYGKDTGSCDTIKSMMPKSKSGGGAGKFFFWVFFLGACGAGTYYFLKITKEKRGRGGANSGASDGLMT
eukprot:scaffold74226_cov51-Attheya_sp.AAC.5